MFRLFNSENLEAPSFIGAFLLSIALMLTDHFSNITDHLRSTLYGTITPVINTAALPIKFYNYLSQDFTTIDQLRLENNALKAETLILKSKQNRMTFLEQQNHYLQALINKASQIETETIQIAGIKAFNISPVSQTIHLDIGEAEGVRPNQTVMDDRGILGQVFQTQTNTSQVLLITDIGHQIPVRVERTGQRGILKGSGYEPMQLKFVSQNSDIVVGDILISSGLGGVFPQGFPVAKVISIESHQELLYLNIQAKPISDIEKNSLVLVITSSPKKDSSSAKSVGSKMIENHES